MMRETIVIVGAGSAVFTRGLVADLLALEWEADLRLVDTDPQALETADKLTRKMIEANRSPIQLRSSTDLREVLSGATVVISTIGVGGRRAWELDVEIPRRFGIWQPVGDTSMPGGLSRALRMIPATVAIAQAIADLAPDALFFNYANPMSAVCRGVRKATGVPVTGLCHGVHFVERYLARALDVDPSRFRGYAVGLNHLTWFVEAYVDGKDAMPELRAIAAKAAQGETVSKPEGTPGTESASPVEKDPFSWRLLHLFGAFPSALDRHVVEFFPHLFRDGDYYGRKLGVEAFDIAKVIANGDQGYQSMRETALSPDPLPPEAFRRGEGEHEQVLEIVESIRHDRGRLYSANLPNGGQIPNLPTEAIIESPARAAAGGLRPVAMPPLSPGLAGTLATRCQTIETIVEAALEKSREKFIQALVLDGSLNSLDDAPKLADALLQAHSLQGVMCQ